MPSSAKPGPAFLKPFECLSKSNATQKDTTMKILIRPDEKSKFTNDEQRALRNGSMCAWSERTFELASEYQTAQTTIAACETELEELKTARDGDPEKMSAKIAAKQGTAAVLRDRLVLIRLDFLKQRIQDLNENLELDGAEYEKARAAFKDERLCIGAYLNTVLCGDIEMLEKLIIVQGDRIYTLKESVHLEGMSLAKKMITSDTAALTAVTAELNTLEKP